MPDGPSADNENPLETPQASEVSTYAARSRQKIAHITDRFIPISHILTALTRASYRDLQGLESQLSDLSDQKRKRKLVDYAAKLRLEYVKVLVLVNWASRAQEVSTAIDLRAWLHGQKNCFDNLYASLRFGLQRSLDSAKVKAPELLQASEILATGKLGRIKGLETDKQDRSVNELTPPRILQTLKTLNSLITLRLMLHEILPTPMQDFSVESGRATFHVRGEFAVDVFFASEDLESRTLQWFMVDFRFDFGSGDDFETPLSLRLEVEHLANMLLGRANVEQRPQLVQLYNFLHRLTLQYRLERLFNQFSRIGSREKGRIDLKYASAQKVLVVGYWLQKRHRENKTILNSLSITIEQGKTKPQDRLLATSSAEIDYNRDILVLKVRTGDQEKALDSFDFSQVSASSILTAAIEQRAAAAISHLYDHLVSKDLPFVEPVRIENHRGLIALRIALSSGLSLIIEIDHFNGNFIVHTDDADEGSLRGTDFTADALQISLNSLTNAREQAGRVHSYRFASLKAEIMTLAESAGWACPDFTMTSLNTDDFGSAFGSGHEIVSPKSCIFMTRREEAWKTTTVDASWFLVCTIRPTGYSFWVAEFEIDERLAKWRILWVERLRFDGHSAELSFEKGPTRHLFDRLWRLSTARIICLQLSRGLAERNIDHRFTLKTTNCVWITLQIPSIVLAADDISGTDRIWSSPLVTVRISNICPDHYGGLDVTFETQKLAAPEFDLGQCRDLSILADQATQQICFTFKAFVTQSNTYIVDLFCQKWRMIENSISIYTAVSRHSEHLYLSASGTQSAIIAYGSDRSFLLHVEQQPLDHINIGLAIMLSSSTARNNPHLRISMYLQEIAVRFQSNFNVVLKMLLFTLPVLEAINSMEQESMANPEFYVMVRSVDEYRIYYTRKNIALLLHGRSAPRTEQLPDRYKSAALTALWHFTDASRSTSNTIKGQSRISSCDDIFNNGLNSKFDTDQTFPEGSGIGCTAEYAGRVLLEVHRTILDHQPAAGEAIIHNTESSAANSGSINGKKAGPAKPKSKGKGKSGANLDAEIIEIS